jgi:clan AA aspartic protease
MGIFRVSLQVGNPFTGQTETVDAVVDTGAVDSVMPTSLLRRLGIEPVRSVRYRTASGERVEYEVGSAYFSAEGFRCIANVVFGPEDNPLMGATTLEQLYLAVDPRSKQLVPVEGLLL